MGRVGLLALTAVVLAVAAACANPGPAVPDSPAARLAVKLDILLDGMPEPTVPVNAAVLRAWTFEILPYFEYEGVIGQAVHAGTGCSLNRPCCRIKSPRCSSVPAEASCAPHADPRALEEHLEQHQAPPERGLVDSSAGPVIHLNRWADHSTHSIAGVSRAKPSESAFQLGA